MWGDDVIRHKYQPLPEEAPRHRKKSRKRHVRSDHRHEYEQVCIDTDTHVIHGGRRTRSYHLAERCVVCGRLRDVHLWAAEERVPDGMPLYRVDDIFELVRMKELPEGMRVDHEQAL